MISERQMNFRKEYRSRIAGWYNGYVHVAVIYIIGLTALYIYTRHIDTVLWWEWLTVPAVIMFSNMFEWFLHMHVMHRPLNSRGLRAIYVRHTLNHHQFFSDHEMRFRDDKDWRVTFFPPYALVVFIFMSIPAGLAGGYLITPNAGQYDPAPSHGPSQRPADDGSEHEPDLPHLRLDVRHFRSGSGVVRTSAQRLFHQAPENRPQGSAHGAGGGRGRTHRGRMTGGS
jgi:hypothetical protein